MGKKQQPCASQDLSAEIPENAENLKGIGAPKICLFLLKTTQPTYQWLTTLLFYCGTTLSKDFLTANYDQMMNLGMVTLTINKNRSIWVITI